MSEQAYKIEVYYQGRSVFKAGYHNSLEDAEKTAKELLDQDESVSEVRILDHGGKILGTRESQERCATTGNRTLSGNKKNPLRRAWS